MGPKCRQREAKTTTKVKIKKNEKKTKTKNKTVDSGGRERCKRKRFVRVRGETDRIGGQKKNWYFSGRSRPRMKRK